MAECHILTNKLILNLRDRGYSYEILRKTAHMVSFLKRDDLLQYKDKSNSFGLIDNKTFIFKANFDNSLSETQKCIKKAFHKVSNENEKLNNTKLKIINKIQPNLGAILINNFKLPKIMKYFCTSCCLNYCKLCRFINKDYKIKINDKCTIPIVNNSNCHYNYNCHLVLFLTLNRQYWLK